MANLYEWESKAVARFQGRGDAWLSYALIAAGIVIILIGLFSRSVIFKSLVAAYVFLP